MSTKTTFKRVALVAAVAAAFGGLSTVAANAVTTAAFPSVINNGTGANGVATAALETTTVTATPTTSTYQSVTLTPGTNDSVYTISTSGVGTVYFPTLATDGSKGRLSSLSTTSTLFYAGATPGAQVFSTEGVLTFTAYSSAAGTQTITFAGNGTGTKAIVDTITWGAGRVVSATYSKAVLSGHTLHANGTASTDDSVAVVDTVGTLAGEVVVTVNGDDNNAFTNGTATVAATVSGPGLVLVNNSATDGVGTARSSSATLNTAYVHISADGTSGTSTVSITATDPNTGITTTIASKSVVFTGTTPASINASQSSFVAAPGLVLGTADTVPGAGAFTAQALDANGNPVAALTTLGSSSSVGWYTVSDNTACIKSGVTAVSDGGAAVASSTANAYGTYNVTVTAAPTAVSGCSANVTLHYYVSSTSDLVAAPVKFTVGGSTATQVSASTDAASYTPGQKVTLTVALKDVSGNPVADGYYGIWYDAAQIPSGTTTTYAPFTTSAQLTTNPFGITGSTAGVVEKSYYVSNGVATATFYAPYADGAVTLTSTLAAANTTANALATTLAASGIAAALQGTTLSATVNVTTGASTASQAATDAANEATDAANAATDAANAAADAADAATSAAQDASAKADAALAAVNALSAKITVLAAQIAKIVKKLKA